MTIPVICLYQFFLAFQFCVARGYRLLALQIMPRITSLKRTHLRIKSFRNFENSIAVVDPVAAVKRELSFQEYCRRVCWRSRSNLPVTETARQLLVA